MNFLNPFFLFGLIAVAIPVVIHLINLRRPQKVSFSTLAFFNELRKSTIRRIRIKQYLLMALRALALLFLALALARPFLPPTLTGSTSSGGQNSVAIIIDNSPSMNRIGSRGPLISQAKETANQIIANGSYSDKFLIAPTNGSSGANTFVNGARGQELVDEISVQNTAHYTPETVREVYAKLQDSPEPKAIIYIISDGQKSQLSDIKDISLQGEDSEMKQVSLQLINLEQGRQQNITVSSVELKSQMLSKGSPISLTAEVENTGSAAAANQFVSLEVDGELSGQYEVSLEPGETEEFLFQIVPEKTGDITGRIIVEGDEVTYDNTRYFVIRIPEKRPILLINNERGASSFGSYLAPALEAAQQTNAQLSFVEKRVSEADQSEWPKYEAIALDGLEQIPEYWFEDLQRFVQEGNGVLFLPSEQGDVENYNRFLSLFNAGSFDNVVGEYASFKPAVKMGELEEEHPVINELFNKKEGEAINMDLPSLFFYYHYKEPANSGSLNILKAANGDPLLSEQDFGEGLLLISAIGAGPGWSNFPVNPLFAPLFYRSMLYASSPENDRLKKHQLGETFVWEGTLQQSEVMLELNEAGFKPELQQRAEGIRISHESRKWQPGILKIKAGGEERKIAVNQHIMESRFDALEQQEWQETAGEFFSVNEMINAENLSVEKLNEKLNTAVFGKRIWHWFVWLALFFLITETLVSRLYKAESI